MRRTSRQRWIFRLAIALGLAPPVFASMRALNARGDPRMAWMAFASFLGASLVMAIGKGHRRKPGALLALAAAALVSAMLLAGWTAFRLGATATFGIWAVSFVLSFCWAASYALAALSRPRIV
jgi:hypothetical protein